LLTERSAKAIKNAIENLIANYPDRVKTRRYSERFGWEEISKNLLTLFKRSISAQ